MRGPDALRDAEIPQADGCDDRNSKGDHENAHSDRSASLVKDTGARGGKFRSPCLELYRSDLCDSYGIIARVKAIEQGVVMGDDLLEAKDARVCRHVSIGGEHDVVAEADGAAHGGVNAVLGHASGDHDSTDVQPVKLGFQSSLKKRITGAFVDHRLGGEWRDLFAQFPGFAAGLQTMAFCAVVLDEEYGHSGVAGPGE